MITAKIKEKFFISGEDEYLGVLKDINIEIQPREFVTIIGPSGCGKTTLLRIIAGFDDDFKGEINFHSPKKGLNNDLVKNSRKQSKNLEISRLGKVGYIPQDFSLFPWFTVEENIQFALKAKKVKEEEQPVIIDKLLELVKMKDYRNFYPKEISGGMKQKIAICRALAINPASNLILMDEPFSALDAQTRNKLQQELLDICEQQALTILFVTHNIDEAVFLSDRVLIMSNKPARMIHEEVIHFSHPRDRTSVEFNQIRRKLLNML